ncbi:MAG: hypothetical protein ACLR8Y_19020 [Alistipes indistinctus]
MAMRSLVHSGSYLLADNIALVRESAAEQTPAGDRFTEGIKQLNRMVTGRRQGKRTSSFPYVTG